VKQVTSGRFSFGHGRPEPAGGIGIDNGLVLEAGMEAQAMGQQFQACRSGSGQTVWLSMLVDAMEKFSGPGWRALPCDRLELAAARAQLARPVPAYPAYASRFSLRN
jgi:hypothetical protein